MSTFPPPGWSFAEELAKEARGEPATYPGSEDCWGHDHENDYYRHRTAGEPPCAMSKIAHAAAEHRRATERRKRRHEASQRRQEARDRAATEDWRAYL